VIQLFGPGVKKPGDIVQSLYMESTAQTQNSSATPVNTQATLSITPTSAANVVRATSTGTLYSDTAGAGALAQIYRGSTAVGTVAEAFGGSGAAIASATMVAIDHPNSVAPVNYTTKLYMNVTGTPIGSFPLSGSGRNVNMLLEEIMG
jgi:hypothetical protein